jgi:hypothetical protein
LFWLNVVELGAAADDAPAAAFRLTPAGAVSLGLKPLSPPTEPPPLTLRADFTVSAPPDRRYERFQLSLVADWVQTGDPFIYRLTPTSLERARRQGISILRILTFLNRAVEDPAALRSLESALTRWETRGAEVRLERSLLLRLDSEELLNQLLAAPRIRPFIRERIAPTIVAIHERDWPRLVAALGEMGLLTDVMDGGGEASV